MEAVVDQLCTLKELGKPPKDGPAAAIDAHLMPRYDRTRGAEPARSRYKNGTMFYERYVTAQCVNDGARVRLGFITVPAPESVPAMAHKMIGQYPECGVQIKIILFDREFFAAENSCHLDRLGVNYIMPCRNAPTVAGD